VRLWVCVVFLALQACAGQSAKAPVEDRDVTRSSGVAISSNTPRRYTVVSGDTLYSIAWRYGFDYRELAAANNIPRPYRIFVGQALKLMTAPAAPAPSYSNSTRKSSSAASVTKSTPKTPPKTTVSGPAPVASNNRSGSGSSAIAWRWPTRGKVIRGFSGTVHKGIDIDGQSGDAVVSVAAGKVVYSGSGIVGYGKLLIIKHNDIYLSAYGHNRRLLVKEGERVSAGQKIAEKGSSATNAVKLHFEIRREGKPVDPKKLLAAR
jgi:lipoprotein NlpD